MIISHKHKACYWKVARTGSNTVELCLRMRCDLGDDAVVTGCHFFPASQNVPDDLPFAAHFRPTDAIREGLLTEDQYETYSHYVIMRDPWTRFRSAYMLRWQDRADCPDPIRYLEARRKDPSDPMDWLLVPQSEYLDDRTIVLPFEDFETSVRTVVEGFSGSLPDVPKLAHRRADSNTKASRAALQAVSGQDLDAALQRCYGADKTAHQRFTLHRHATIFLHPCPDPYPELEA